MVWRIRSSPTKLVCAVGSRNGTEETKLLVLDFDAEVSYCDVVTCVNLILLRCRLSDIRIQVFH